MNLKLFLAIGTSTACLVWSGGFAQALEGGHAGGDAAHGALGSGPSGQTASGLPTTNNMDIMSKGSGHMDIGTPQQGGERGMQHDSGRGGRSGSALDGGGMRSSGSTGGSGSAGMEGTSGGKSGGGGK